MATAKKIPAVVETVEKVVTPETFEVTLSADEAAGLAALMGYGIHWKTLDKLKLNSLHDQLSSKVGWKAVGEANPGFKKLATDNGVSTY